MSEKNYFHRPAGSPQPRERESQKAQLESLSHGESKDVKRKIAYQTGEEDWEEKARSAHGKEGHGELQSRFQDVLDSDKDLKGYGLNVRGGGGEVEISGIVDTLSESKRAEELAASFPGVQKVVNDLTISTDGNITDADVTKEVREELNADPRVDLSHIGAEAHGGAVILMGSTENPDEIEAAKQTAAKARGVRKVVSQVKLKDDFDMSLEGIFHSQVRNDEED
ncbi:periplasmic protein [Pelotomaculum schinkii]|uniref:Periplasmic protein n=1 Tax=Pelotomaculum schinkii TaxID=78350 RepID=A0A4Y7R796_9FIRM|nr:BON domain-containing protein [Pelotomaculum schinkii]TEB04828.1 periplasmic protein [Pelotomaculum schinkii]